MDWSKAATTAVLLVVWAVTIVGNFYFQRWNRQRGERLAAEAQARGETLPDRTATRVLLVTVAVILIVSGVWLTRG